MAATEADTSTAFLQVKPRVGGLSERGARGTGRAFVLRSRLLQVPENICIALSRRAKAQGESKVAELYGEKLGAPTRMSRKRAISSGERLGIREGNARLCGWHFSRAGAALRTTDASCLAGAGFGANQSVVFGTFSLAFWYAGLEVSAHYPCWYACSQRL